MLCFVAYHSRMEVRLTSSPGLPIDKQQTDLVPGLFQNMP
jgi:hypothetical protein